MINASDKVDSSNYIAMVAMSFEYSIIVCIVIAICLPLLPNRKLRYYTCYISYASTVSVICFLLLPVGILRPMNIANLKLAATFVKHFTKILRIKWELRNKNVLKKDRGAVIVSNHQSIFDIMGMYNIWDVMDKCTAVVKKEMMYAFPSGTFGWLGGLIFIDRADPRSAKRQINATAHIIHNRKAKLWIFAEGTRNQTGKGILPFKKGAFRVAIELQVPIIPIVYSPYYFIDSKNKSFAKGKIIISALEPISTKGLTLSDTDLLKEKTHKLISTEYEKLQCEISIYQGDDSK